MTDIYYHLSHFVFVGYTVTSVVSARSGQLYVAGAPRFNHTGKVIIFTLKNTGELTILHSLKGQQVMKLKICTQTLAAHSVCIQCCSDSFFKAFVCLQWSCLTLSKYSHCTNSSDQLVIVFSIWYISLLAFICDDVWTV